MNNNRMNYNKNVRKSAGGSKDGFSKKPFGQSERTGERKGFRSAPRADKKKNESMSARQIVLRILSDFDSRPGDPEIIAEKILSRKRLDDRDRRFVFELVYGILRNRIYLDYVIDSFLTSGRELEQGTLRRILQLGAYQILFLDRVPDHAAVNESVDIAKNDSNLTASAGFVNAILRNVIRNKFEIVLPDPQVDLSLRLSVEFSHPKWMVERWLARYGLRDTKKILAFNNERPVTYLRRVRTSEFTRGKFDADVHTLCEPGCGFLNLYYKLKINLDVEALRLLQDGYCVVQAPSSGWAVAMLDLAGGDSVIDLCAAPGGKTTLISECIDSGGVVVACDKSRFKMGMLYGAVQKLKLENVYPLICDGTKIPLTRTFKKVLLDAPCTGSGVLHRHPDGRFVRTADDVKNMQKLQRELLVSAAKLVDNGGTLVYSTCSLEPEENEEQVAWFLETHTEFKLVSPPKVVPAAFVDSKECLRITPFEHAMDGMFAARLMRF